MKNKTLQLAGVLALVAVIGKFYAVPAYAQVRAALVQNRDEVGRNFYFVNASCSTVTFGYCQLDFPAVPAGKRLIVKQVSALQAMGALNSIQSIDLRTKNHQIGAFLTPKAMPANNSTLAYYAENESVLVNFDAGDQPEFIVFTNSSANFTSVVTLTGYMIDIP